MGVTFGVLGPVTAWDAAEDPVALRGPRHRAVLARLIVARRRVVPVTHLVDDLWDDPPQGAISAVRTFVAALRRALEPARPPRAPATLLVTEGPGYALRAAARDVDAWRFEHAVTTTTALPPDRAASRLREALGWWRGPAYADFADQDWARAERSRLAELRLHAVERLADARLSLGLAAETVPDLDAHVAEHPWREEGWRLLGLALYRTGRQGEALAVLRRARTLLVEQLGVDPGPALRRLETDILHQADHLHPAGLDTTAALTSAVTSAVTPAVTPGAAAGPVLGTTHGLLGAIPRPLPGTDPDPGSAETADRVWARAAALYDRAVAPGARARLESTVALLRNLAVTGGGGLRAAREHRVAAIAAAEELGDAELTARVIGAYDVPAIWTRSDDPRQAAHVIAAAERALGALPASGCEAARARLLATIALESRGSRLTRGPSAARQAEDISRSLQDPGLLAFALNGVFMQSFDRTGLAGRRDGLGAELVALSARHGLVTYEVLGHLVRMQARAGLGDLTGADGHAAAVDGLAGRHELPLAGVFTRWYRATRLAETGRAPFGRVEAAYRQAAELLDGSGMPGLEDGLLPLALLCARLRYGMRGPAHVHGGRRPHPSSTGLPTGPPAVLPTDRDGALDSLDTGLPVQTGLPAFQDGGEGGGGGPEVSAFAWTRELSAWSDSTQADWGPYEPWIRPLVLLSQGRRREAASTLRETPEPPRDLLMEALWCLTGRAALALGDRRTMERVHAELLPAEGELAGAGSGVLTLGPVAHHLADLATALGRTRQAGQHRSRARDG
ncbi:AfsR/SARP family transcriptional regulator [Nonomuraea indica]|uniref:AfsR/SARP family transcriptional regulator n=1 Tax=Nonomuraea indica TaxID=1581193 RepID=UPI001FEC4E7F|nr:AfsR/SARP family transcriptional regulator [Nonomuraea indica]